MTPNQTVRSPSLHGTVVQISELPIKETCRWASALTRQHTDSWHLAVCLQIGSHEPQPGALLHPAAPYGGRHKQIDGCRAGTEQPCRDHNNHPRLLLEIELV